MVKIAEFFDKDQVNQLKIGDELPFDVIEDVYHTCAMTATSIEKIHILQCVMCKKKFKTVVNSVKSHCFQ